MKFRNRSIEAGIVALFVLTVLAYCSMESAAGQAFRDSNVSTGNNADTATGDADVLKRPQDSLILGMNVDSVSILVTARNKKGDYIGNLNATDFQILEDGEEQPIKLFRQDTIPVNVVFLVDASYSVNDVLQNIIESAVTFAGRLRAGDKFSAVIFAHKPIKVLDWTDNVPAFQNILRNVKTFGKTALYDSMEYTIDNMFERVQGKKAIIILSDGVDNSSTKSLTKVMRLAAEREVTIYPIIHSYPQSQHFREMAKNNRQKLQNVSKFFLAYIDAQNEFIDLVARNGGPDHILQRVHRFEGHLRCSGGGTQEPICFVLCSTGKAGDGKRF